MEMRKTLGRDSDRRGQEGRLIDDCLADTRAVHHAKANLVEHPRQTSGRRGALGVMDNRAQITLEQLDCLLIQLSLRCLGFPSTSHTKRETGDDCPLASDASSGRRLPGDQGASACGKGRLQSCRASRPQPRAGPRRRGNQHDGKRRSDPGDHRFRGVPSSRIHRRANRQ